MRGRKPTPTPVLQVRGTFRKGRHASRAAEPSAPGDLRQPPGHFSVSQQEAWVETVANSPANILRAVDRGVLAAYVIALDQHRQAAVMQIKIDQGAALPLLAKAKDGSPVVSPYIRVMNRAAEIMIRTASEMGFTPVARTRLATPSVAPAIPDPNSAWARLRLLQGGRNMDPSSAA